MQCNITGCTMIFNRKLANLSLPFPKGAIMHDFWVALVAAGLGQMDYIQHTTIAYRQHGNNVSGGADKFNVSYIIQKASKIFDINEYNQVLGRQIVQAKSFLNQYRKQLTDEKIKILEAMISLQSSSFLEKIVLMKRYRLYKQNTIRNLGLLIWFLKISSGLKK
jgi:hypothetical protein